MKRFLIAAVCLVALALPSHAQKVAVQTNLLDWAALGTINAEAQVSISQHFTFALGGRYNPWTLGANSDKPISLQQRNVYTGVRFWPWYIYSGWWFGGKLQWIEFERSGILTKGTITGKGGAGLGLSAGYCFMLNPHFNLEVGGGIAGNRYSYYNIVVPGEKPLPYTGSQSFIQPDFLSASLVYIF